MRDCPHCFRRVLPAPNGECPACHRDTKTPPNTDRKVVVVGEDSILPEICCHCGNLTKRKEALTRSRTRDLREIGGTNTPDDDWAILSIIGYVFGNIPARLVGLFADTVVGSDHSDRITVRVSIRHCKPCAQFAAIEPQLVDYDLFKMRFVVHSRFAQQFESLNTVAPTS